MSYVGLRIPYFSTPLVYWQGAPIGLPEGDPRSADNARSVNQTAPVVGARRAPQIVALQSPAFLGSGAFAFNLVGPQSQSGTYDVEYTADYWSWAALGSCQFSGGSLQVSDASVTPSTPARFYRAKRGGNLVGSQLGFVRKSIPAGWSMIGTQVDCGDYRIPAIWPTPPNGTMLYKWNGTGYEISTFYVEGNESLWDPPDMTLSPGEGGIVRSPQATTLELVGSVWQSFNVHLPLDWSIVCSPAPQAGSLSSQLAYPYGIYGEKVYLMTDGTESYTVYTSGGNARTWGPCEPSLRTPDPPHDFLSSVEHS